MKKIIFYTLTLLIFSKPIFAQQNFIQAGPMVGYCDIKEAVIWLQTKSNVPVKVAYFLVDNPSEIFYSDTYQSSKEEGYTYHIVLDQLQEGKRYNYYLIINNEKVVLPYETSFTSKKLWEWRTDAPDFKIAFGSCSYINEPALDRPGKPYGSSFEIFESINKKSPDIMIWGGDNTYLREGDWDTKTGIYHRYTHSRSLKELQPLLGRSQNFAIWDDHDYGPNDSDRSFGSKYITQKAFRNFWANKNYGTTSSQNEGVFSSFVWSDAEFFFLDNRFFRSPNNRKTGDKTILGKEQLEWLIDALSFSNANFKIIVIGGQVINSAKVLENYSNYEEERNKLIEEITINQIKGVFFLTGDRHYSELSALQRPNTYPLYDWTVSPLTSGTVSEKYVSKDNLNQVAGSDFYVNNFATISFVGEKSKRKMELQLWDKKGILLWSRIITKKELE